MLKRFFAVAASYYAANATVLRGVMSGCRACHFRTDEISRHFFSFSIIRKQTWRLFACKLMGQPRLRYTLIKVMSSLLTTLPTLTSTAAPLRLMFNSAMSGGSMLGTSFTDGTVFSWNPTQPVATAAWSGFFCDAGGALPATYLNLPVMNNLSAFTWAWPSTTGSTMNTVAMPTGYLTLYGMMNTLYTATQQTISSAQFADIVGTTYTGSGSPTLKVALNQYVAMNPLGLTLALCNITQESATVLRIGCW